MAEERNKDGGAWTATEDVALHVAAVEGTESTTVSIIQSIKDNPRVIFYSLLMDIGPLIYGYDVIIVGVCTAMGAFLENYGFKVEGPGGGYALPSLWIALWNALTSLGGMIGAYLAGPLLERLGRRVSMMIGAIICAIAVAIMYASDRVSTLDGRRGTFLAGKIILGLSLGVFQVTSTTYMSEIAPPRIRGPLLSTFSFVLILGQLIAGAIVGAQIVIPGPTSYRVSLASQWAFAGWALIVGFIIPESPAYYLKLGDKESARKTLHRLHKPEFVEANLEALQATLEHERQVNQASQDATFKECFQGTNMRRSRIVLFMNVVQQALGVTLIANSTYFLIRAGMAPKHSIDVLIIGLCISLCSNVASWFLMTTIGRRRMIMIGTTVVAFMWLSIAIAGFWPGSNAALWYIGVMINLVLVFYHLGVGGATPVIAGETPSLRLRGKSQSLGFIAMGFFSMAFNLFVPYMFNVDEGNWGAKTGFFFAGLCVLAMVYVWFEIPEMKNRTYAEIDVMFEIGLPTRKFRTYVVDSSQETKVEGDI